ncbi:hypothetical protein WICMUC_003689 [Wickerhamomyces mucosus]|uniref:Tetrapyrrole biosynthesis uroporphyrinogen III synthase domain-containing protein n=1 Tax=Wickerhamomyces mucosus TaxID=1378264 RepID=A0A9P8TCE7_9ASCO|nr:hypothetical protein WICMUC_003689 [Wickerhamomyces mucosus]
MSIYLLKNKTVPKDPYFDAFNESRYSTTFIPLLDHTHTNLPETIEFLASLEFLENYNHLIITSQRAVEVLDLALHSVPSDTREKIFKKTAYTVGPATSKILYALGFQFIKGGSEAGNGDILSDIIIDDLKNCKNDKIIFFTGETRRDIIPRKLTSSGYCLTELVIYKTILKPNIAERFTQVYDKSAENSWIIFFSPQGTSEIIDYLNTLKVKNFKIASIGPTTEKFLLEQGIVPNLVSSKPEATTLLQELHKHSL